MTLSNDRMICRAGKNARISIPEDPAVAYPGKGFEDLFMILTSIAAMRKDSLPKI
jgi:hypothetical protein